MSFRSKCAVAGAFICRLPNAVFTIIRLVFLQETLTPTNSPYWAARVQSITQLAIGYTVTACVIPYLRPLMQAYENADGSLRRPSTVPSFKLSERSSQRSRNASTAARSGMLAIQSGTSQKNSSLGNTGQAPMAFDEQLKMSQNSDMSGIVRTTDWRKEHKHRSSIAGPSRPNTLEVEMRSDQRKSLPSSFPGDLGAGRDGFDAADWA